MNRSVPVLLRECVQWFKHDWHDGLYVFMHQIDNEIIIPKVESPLCNLKMRTGDTLSDLFKDGHTDFGKLAVVNDIQDFFDFI